MDTHPVPKIHTAFDRNFIADYHVILNKRVGAYIAIPANLGSRKDYGPLPNPGINPDIGRANFGKRIQVNTLNGFYSIGHFKTLSIKFFVIIVVSDIVLGIISMRSKHQADRTGRKILFGGPYPWRNVQTVVRTIQTVGLPVYSIVNQNLEGSASCNQKLMARLVGMGSPILSSGNIVKIENAADLKWNLILPGDWRNVSGAILYDR